MEPKEYTTLEAVEFTLENQLSEQDFKRFVTILAADHPQTFLELLEENGVDIGQLAGLLARKNPNEFMRIMHKQQADFKGLRNVIDCLIANQRVGAIKTLREVCELGLKEAKDACDLMLDYLAWKGALNLNPGMSVPVPPRVQDCAAETLTAYSRLKEVLL